MKKYFLFLIIGILFISGCVKESFIVSKVIDGDTIEINNERIRLLGIDSPERGQYYYEQAKNKLEELILGKEVRLERGENDKDKYGRLLRYVFIDDVFVNLELVREAYAKVIPAEKYFEQLKEIEKLAKEKNLGVWFSKTDVCINISFFHFNAKGNDEENLNDEYFVLKNKCDEINMNNWIIRDYANNTYKFYDFSLKDRVTIYSGCGNDNEKELYWCSKNAIWNNNGDTFYLINDKNSFVIINNYEGY